MKKKLLFIFALLCTVAQGAWADGYNRSINLNDYNEDVTVTAGEHWEIYYSGLGVFKHRIIIKDGATVTLSSVKINSDCSVTAGDDAGNGGYAGITCLGDATIILVGENIVKGFNRQYPGIQAAKRTGEGAEYTLTIKGEGSLNVSSKSNATPIAPGIGGPAFGSCGNIEIQGGTIIATGGGSSAGIGCGPSADGDPSGSSCGNITISGGNVTATGGEHAAGIGVGHGIYSLRSTCGNITITGGTVSATGGNNASGIGGSSSYGDCGDITITMDVTSVSATMGAGATKSIGSDQNCGTVTIGGVVYPDGISTSPFTFIPLPKVTSSLTAVNGTMLSGTLANNVKISIADGASVTLRDVSINATGSWTTGDYAGITCLGDATLILEGENSVKGFNASYPGIQPAKRGEGDRYTLTIEGNGSLNASSNGSGAGIGSGCDNIVINSGIINATGGNDAAGIGSSCNDITINGGTINAIGGTGGAGIGGSCHAITINGGTVTATGGTYAAGIGCGKGEGCGDITIANTVTNVTATKGDGAFHCIGKGAGVANCGEVTIGGTEYWGWYENGWIYNNDGEKYLKCNSLVYLKANADGKGNYWTTYYSDVNHYQAPSGTQVFKIMLDGSTLTLGKIESGIVNSAQGVVLKSTSPNYFLTSTTASTDYEGNSLEGTMSLITNPGNVYVLNYTDDYGVGFYKLSSTGTIDAHKAYLGSTSGAREFFSFAEATGLKDVIGQKEEGSGDYYDLQGRKVAQLSKGLYIKDGKKYIKK